jgi:hypothetical protein
MDPSKHTIFVSLQIPYERGLRLFAELLVYSLQRCMCGNPCMCIKQPKLINLLQNWPGTINDRNEERALFFMAGKIMGHPMYMSMVNQRIQLDLGMGAEYCIHKIVERIHELDELEKIAHQEKYN